MNSTAAVVATAFNMHTDLVIAKHPDGSLTLTAVDTHARKHAVTISSVLAHRLGTAAGRTSAPSPAPHAVAPPSPFNMHTDARTKVEAVGRTKIVIAGPGTAPNGSAVSLTITIDGPALDHLRGAHPGL